VELGILTTEIRTPHAVASTLFDFEFSIRQTSARLERCNETENDVLTGEMLMVIEDTGR
jgi:hypothetical protein